MKYKMITLILALSAVAWAQTASQNATPQQSPAASAKTECACCDKADAKDVHSCCAHHDMSAHDMSPKDGKEAMSCGGKDGKSCCSSRDGESCKRADKDKTAASSDDRMKDHGKNCCAMTKNNDAKIPMSCCKEHCSAHASAGTSI